MDKSHKTGETIKHSAGEEKGDLVLWEGQSSRGLKGNFLLLDIKGDCCLESVFKIMIFSMPLTLLICKA